MAFRLFRRSHGKSKRPPPDSATTTSTVTVEEADPDVQEKLRQARDYGASLGAAPEAQQDVPPPPTAEESAPTAVAEQHDAVLSDEDERFLERLASQAEDETTLADTPQDNSAEASETGTADQLKENNTEEGKEEPAKDDSDKKRKSTSWFSLPEGYSLASFAVMPSFKRQKSNNALPLPVTAPAATAGETAEERAERSSIDNILHRLHLDTDKLNNRVISLSDDSKKLLADFNQLVRDVIAGAPYAYDDLDRFMRQRHGEIEALYDGLPPFLQSFIKSLPSKLVVSYAPELAAAAGIAAAGAGGSKDAKKRKDTVPPLKKLLATRGAVASMLRSSIAFLEARFPLLLGWSNVLVSLALFILLFVFWYCHKRGREERVAAEDVAQDVARAAALPVEPDELDPVAGEGAAPAA